MDYASQLTLPYLVRLLQRAWRLPVFGMLAGLALAVIGVWMVAPEYDAVMVIGPTAQTGYAAMGARLPTDIMANPSLAEHSQNEGLSDYARYLQLMTSVDVAKRVIDDVPNILPALFSDEWNDTKKTWHPPLGFAARLAMVGRLFLNQPSWQAPESGRLAAYLQQHVMVQQVAGTSMRRLILRHTDRGLAINILLSLHKNTDALLKEEAARRSESVIDYINRQLQSVTQAEQRAALTRLLAGQEQTRILIAVNLPYAADIIEAPHANTQPDWPNGVVWVVLGGFLGMIIGGGFMMGRDAWQSYHQYKQPPAVEKPRLWLLR